MTGLGKQAKVLKTVELKRVTEFVANSTRFPERNLVILSLSFFAGLRAKEIAGLTWEMVIDGDTVGDELEIRNSFSKGKSGGRRIGINSKLKPMLEALWTLEKKKGETDKDRGTLKSYVVTLVGGNPNLKPRAASVATLFNGKGKHLGWFARVGLAGASSHSGRRYFGTNLARQYSKVGGSLVDVQALLGHQSLQQTQSYIDENEDAKRSLIELL
jgi:integrase/recombinase XerD